MAIQSLNSSSVQGSGGYPTGPAATAETRQAPPPQAAPAAHAEPKEQKTEPSHDQLQQAVEQMRQAIQARNNNLQFSVDKETGKTVVRVVDAQNGETIRQIPSEEALALSKSLDKLQGLLLSQKA